MKQMVPVSENNLLQVLGVADREDPISNLVHYCFLHSDTFRSAFLTQVCDVHGSTEGWTARKRLQISGHGTPDLILARPGDPGTLVVIENKLSAKEGSDQTERYGSPECLRLIGQKMKVGPGPDTHLRFLTLYPDEARNPEFKAVEYAALLDISQESSADDFLAAMLWRSLHELLEDFYSHRILKADDILLDRLRPAVAGGLDGGYLGFLAFLEKLDLSGLRIPTRFRESKQGRIYYGAVLNKDSWVSAPIDKTGDQWTLPREHYHVHLEPQFNPLNGRFELFVHYETNPYHPVRVLEKHVPDAQYGHYRQRRAAFAQGFAEVSRDHFRIGGRSNQIAKAVLNLEECTVAESETLVNDAIGSAIAFLDKTMAAEYGRPGEKLSANLGLRNHTSSL